MKLLGSWHMSMANISTSREDHFVFKSQGGFLFLYPYYIMVIL